MKQNPKLSLECLRTLEVRPEKLAGFIELIRLLAQTTMEEIMNSARNKLSRFGEITLEEARQHMSIVDQPFIPENYDGMGTIENVEHLLLTLFTVVSQCLQEGLVLYCKKRAAPSTSTRRVARNCEKLVARMADARRRSAFEEDEPSTSAQQVPSTSTQVPFTTTSPPQCKRPRTEDLSDSD